MSTGSTKLASSFFGLFTRVLTGHIVIRSLEWPHQVARVLILAEPAVELLRRKDRRHPVVNT